MGAGGGAGRGVETTLILFVVGRLNVERRSSMRKLVLIVVVILNQVIIDGKELLSFLFLLFLYSLICDMEMAICSSEKNFHNKLSAIRE